MYQVATVKQIQKKDPMKHGDAADLRFQKEWIRSCDEVEKRVIYEASYKAYTVGRTLLLVAVCVCILGKCIWRVPDSDCNVDGLQYCYDACVFILCE